MSDDGLQIFAEEAYELLELAEQALINLDDLSDLTETQDSVNDLFRTFHTIKGAAGLFGLDLIVNFTHIVESVLGKIRENELAISEDLVFLFLASRDYLQSLVEVSLDDEASITEEMSQKSDELTDALNKYLDVKTENNDQDENQIKTEQNENTTDLDSSSQTEEISSNITGNQCVKSDNWHISLRFGVNALRNGMDPYSFILYLNKLGELKHVAVIQENLPKWEEFDPESCYLGFELSLFAPNTTKQEIIDVFEFVQDDCKVFVLPPHSHIDEFVQLIENLPEEELKIGEILLACGALTLNEKHAILHEQDNLKDAAFSQENELLIPQIGDIAVNEKVVEQAVIDAAVKKQKQVKSQKVVQQQSIRVNAKKLENLVDLVGELVISSANTEMNAIRLADTDLNTAFETLMSLVEEVRDTTLGLRMVPIGETFGRYKRVVKEVSRDLGKEIVLEVSGEETELDKTLIEKIADPLMHLVRNAVDHGIESPSVRQQTGKPSAGKIKLDAYQDSGSIVIQISDDGAGLNKEKLVAKAIEKEVISADEELTEQEIFQLIFRPGFSTADQVSNISGRGVGMDVVRKNIESLRGTIEMKSEQCKGTTMSIRLPLTLAIIDGFQIQVADNIYIIPLDMIDECIELSQLDCVNDLNSQYINLRDQILPFAYLSEIFNLPSSSNKSKHTNIVVVKFGEQKAGFVVDELLGEHQTVIKPLGPIFRNVKGVSGATILGSGEVAMVMDVPSILKNIISKARPEHKKTVEVESYE